MGMLRFPKYRHGQSTPSCDQRCGSLQRLLALLLGTRTLLGAPGLTTRNKKLLGTKGIAIRSKDSTSSCSAVGCRQRRSQVICIQGETGCGKWRAQISQTTRLNPHGAVLALIGSLATSYPLHGNQTLFQLSILLYYLGFVVARRLPVAYAESSNDCKL